MEFEDKLKKLENISENMRREDISLDQSISSFEEGMKIAKELEKELNGFEKRIQILISDSEGDHLEDFK